MRLIAAKEGGAAYARQVEAWGEEQVRQLQAMLPVVWAMLSVAPELVKEGAGWLPLGGKGDTGIPTNIDLLLYRAAPAPAGGGEAASLRSTPIGQ
jgi:hypothetical protein